ncbi:hypothetical protein CHLNCDRAFT_135563 [Chlorella variabilis]|uniref:SS18 N-terminal domain-containing protein n=1 Tax=Chlorella variabilis TaxID=554065 RepID=E1ZIG6_CHLVA|nr:hypothetical protein CHLNCDRAFT_135563 [Chlorella variabilis]EFN54156.1 hypothetical protein CHLNCDRAFT_135563 [Chlorella variabilis]|eukprot:XP_005846258.1 hypothetical protein CHLNCDRAFT_135563 [Chlorella variabilis]
MSGPQTQAAGAPKRVLATEEIQQMLEDNAKLIAAIVENQNLGKLDQCIEYQKRLQDNLMSLAALADSQATPPQQQQAAPGQQQAGAGPAAAAGGQPQ